MPASASKFVAAQLDLVRAVNILGYTAALAAYRDGQPWLDELLRYLEANRDFVVEFVGTKLPGVRDGGAGGDVAGLARLPRGRASRPAIPSRSSWSGRRWRSTTARPSAAAGRASFGSTSAVPARILAEALERMRAALERRA